MVLHDLNLASEYCKNLLMIHDGRIKLSGSSEEIFQQDRIEEIYKTGVLIAKNPVSGKPCVLLNTQKTVSPNLVRRTATIL